MGVAETHFMLQNKGCVMHFVLCIEVWIFVLSVFHVRIHIFNYVQVTKWPQLGKQLLTRNVICTLCINT